MLRVPSNVIPNRDLWSSVRNLLLFIGWDSSVLSTSEWHFCHLERMWEISYNRVHLKRDSSRQSLSERHTFWQKILHFTAFRSEWHTFRRFFWVSPLGMTSYREGGNPLSFQTHVRDLLPYVSARDSSTRRDRKTERYRAFIFLWINLWSYPTVLLQGVSSQL